MKRTPYSSDRFILRPNLLPGPYISLSTAIPQKLSLLQHLLHFQISHAYSLLLSIDVVAFDNGVGMWSWRDLYLD